MLKTYKVQHDMNDGEMTVEIDHDVMTDANLHEINSFWLDAEFRLIREDGNVLHAVLKMLLAEVLVVQLEGGLNTRGVVEQFDYDAKFGRGGIEGWPKMDGSAGIKIIDVDGLEFEASYMSITEVA